MFSSQIYGFFIKHSFLNVKFYHIIVFKECKFLQKLTIKHSYLKEKMRTKESVQMMDLFLYPY